MSQTSPKPPAVFYGAGDDVFQLTLHEPGAAAERIREAVVQDIWRYQRFDTNQLLSVQGSRITVVHPGRPNEDTGPDFLDAVIRIDDTELHGFVEVHITSSGWTAHGHESDPMYNGVVLHVVLVSDVFTGKLRRSDGSLMEELELMPRIDTSLRELLYRFYRHEDHDFPCAKQWPAVPAGTRRRLIRRLGRERLNDKARAIASRFLHTPDPDELLHEELFAALGYSKNSEAMRELARRVPLATARRLRDPLDLEAIHFGVAGLLPAPSELLNSDGETADRVIELSDRFARLNERFEIPVMPRSAWKFFRLRPNNFPTLRIAQACSMLASGGLLTFDSYGRLLTALADDDALAACSGLLHTSPPDFWNKHVRLQKQTKPFNPSIGDERKRIIIGNVFIPFALALVEGQDILADAEKIAALAEALPPENDEITKVYETPDLRPASVLETQGIHQLHRSRCLVGRCLHCEIGEMILGAS